MRNNRRTTRRKTVRLIKKKTSRGRAKQVTKRPSRRARSSKLQVKTLRTRKVSSPLMDADTRNTVRRALDALLASPQLDFLKGLQAGELVSKATAPGSLKDFSLEDLAALGADEVCRLPGVSAAALEILANVIQGMAAITPGENFDAPGLMPAAPKSGIYSTRPTSSASGPLFDGAPDTRSKFPTPDLPSFSSTEAELKLFKVIGDLRATPQHPRLLGRQLKEFWSPEWPKAPFEQEMTIRQVIEINIENVLKKRSFTGQKLSAFILALERALESVEKKVLATEPPSITTTASRSTLAAVQNLPGLRFALLGIESSLIALPPVHILRSVFCPMDGWITSAELGAALLTAVEDKTMSEVLVRALQARLSQASAPTLATWEAALAGPAVSAKHLTSAYYAPALDNELQARLYRLIIAALGAKEVTYRESVLRDHWTTSPKSFSLLLDSFLASLPPVVGGVNSELAELFPTAEIEVLLELVANYVEANGSGSLIRKPLNSH